MGRTPTRTWSAALATTTLVASALVIAPTALAAETCDGKTVTKTVSSGTYTGTSGADVILLTGPAVLTLREGNDVVCVKTDGRVEVRLGAGDDKYITLGGTATSTVYGGDGDDTMDGRSGKDKFMGEGGNDVLRGGGGDDTLHGGRGNDHIDGGGGDDVIEGDLGDDDLRGDAGDDTIIGGLGRDTIRGGEGNDSLWGDTTENEGEDLGAGVGTGVADIAAAALLSLGYGNDKLYGEDGNDKLVGDRGDDYLDGGRGDDYLEGGPGSDQLWTGIDIRKADGTWEQVKGDTLIGDYYETRGEGGFPFDNDVLASTPGDNRAEENRPGVVKAVYGGAGDDQISVWGLNSMKIKNAAVVIERLGETWINAGAGKDNVTAMYVEKVEGKSGGDTIKTVGVDTIYGDNGNDLIQPVNWGHAHGGKGVDTFDLCHSPKDAHGYTWGDQELDVWKGGSIVFYAHAGGSTIVETFKNYEASRASTNPKPFNFSLNHGEACPAGSNPNTKLKPLNTYFTEFEGWIKKHEKEPGPWGNPPDPWF